MKKYWVLILWLGLPLAAHAQGVLPGTDDKKPERVLVSSPTVPYLLIGEEMPSKWTVTDMNGEIRSLASYKTSLEILVIEFVSSECPYNQTSWRDLKKFYEAYKDWKVAFVAVSSGKGERVQDLIDAMAKAGLPYPLVRDKNGEIARGLKITGIPEIVILDEDQMVRYRGALHDAIQTPGKRPKTWDAKKAINAVIGHVDSVPEAEPTTFIGCPWP